MRQLDISHSASAFSPCRPATCLLHSMAAVALLLPGCTDSQTSNTVRLPDVRGTQNDVPVGANGVRSDDVRSDGVRSDGVRSDGVRSDGVRSDGVRSDDVRSDDARPGGAEQDRLKSDSTARPNPNTFDLAVQATEAGEYQKAIELFNQLAPTSKDPAVFCNRGNNYSYLGDLDAALADYATALELEHRLGRGRKTRRLASLHYNRGVAYRRNGQPALAIPCYERAIDAKDSYPDACGNLARILATCSVAKLRDPPRAIRLAKQELSRRPEHDRTLDTLAAAYAADGQFQEAQEVQQAALKFAPPERLAEYQDRLFLYSIGQSYVEPLEDAQDTPNQSISGE